MVLNLVTLVLPPLQGDFGPSDLLCPKNKCWVPLDRVRGALEQPGMVPISELPGALQGLGQQHLVDPATSRPTCPPREVGLLRASLHCLVLGVAFDACGALYDYCHRRHWHRHNRLS